MEQIAHWDLAHRAPSTVTSLTSSGVLQMCIQAMAACCLPLVHTKAEFEFPFEPIYESVEDLPQGIENILPSAGDAVIMAEQVFHGSLRWKPVDRDRRVLVMRYTLQYQLARQQDMNMEQAVLDRLAPETRELLETGWRSHEKKISKREIIRLI